VNLDPEINNPGEFQFRFGEAESRVSIREQIPSLEQILEPEDAGCLLVCDPRTEYIARRIMGGRELPLLVLPGGEEAKTWASVEGILRAAYAAGLGRDGLLVGVGGGVAGDLTAFAAAIYMRGARLCLVSTTLLGMVDAALGGKTGFDLFGIKNLAGAFFPAGRVFMPLESLETLPEAEWKSGMAELIKTAILDEDGRMFARLRDLGGLFPRGARGEELFPLIARAVEIKGGIVAGDPRETGGRRALLNLGHTFGHALEAAAGLGRVTHGEAVAWGMVRACELGRALGISPRERGREIQELLRDFRYEIQAPHPLAADTEALLHAMGGDKKKKGGRLVFVVPGEKGAQLTSGTVPEDLVRATLRGACSL
jgi:3-dehydroquinate synthase